ncbi:MAG: phosphonate C-P lyase system protein PhnH [Agrobacterium sp. SCN 61-19]|nr:MAG: phosphonate C-P lyase system protein PhnH [Agrobacterium sp. SCN 61-19]
MDASALIAIPVPNDLERLHNATYDALMWALARPGTVQTLPQPGLEAIVETLVDRECRVFSSHKTLLPLIASTGAAITGPRDADHAFLDLEAEAGLRDLAVVPAGSHLYPDDGATVFSSARIGEGQRLRLSGPGIETYADIRIGGLKPDVWTLRAKRCIYPTGFELFFVDGDRVVGLPRSTTVEVL